MQKKYADKGLAIVAMHAQNVPQAQVVALLVQKGVNYTVTSFGALRNDKSSGIPKMFVFDWTGKCVWQGRNANEADKVIEGLIEKAPHFLTRGRTFESKSVIAEAAKLWGKRYGQNVVALDRVIESSAKEITTAEEKGIEATEPTRTREEASFLRKNIQEFADSCLRRAQTNEKVDPSAAYDEYKEMQSTFKGIEVGEQAKTRYEELKKDKAFQDELKANELLQQITTLSGELRTVRGVPSKGNAKVLEQIKAILAQMEKSYPTAIATGKARSMVSSLS